MNFDQNLIKTKGTTLVEKLKEMSTCPKIHKPVFLTKKDKQRKIFDTSWRGRLDPWERGSPNGTPLGDG